MTSSREHTREPGREGEGEGGRGERRERGGEGRRGRGGRGERRERGGKGGEVGMGPCACPGVGQGHVHSKMIDDIAL